VDIISVRDRWSKKLLRKYGITKPIFVTVDPAFDLRPVDDKTAEKLLDQELLNNESLNRGLLNKALVNNIAAKRDGTGPLVAICPRQVFHRTSKGLANILPVKYRLKLGLIDKKETKRFRRFEKNLAKAADYLVDKFNAKVIFIPMQMSKTQKQQDEKVCHDIIDMMKMKNKRSTIMLNSERYTPKELKGIYGQMDLVMAIRFHALVLGSGMNVPVLSIPYSAKGKRLTKMLGLEVYSMTAEEVANNTEHALIERINNIFANKTSIIKNLNAKNKDFKEMAKFNVMLVDGLLRSR
jgi:polysaccharide pyruvyl transferase WcaK-like protein